MKKTENKQIDITWNLYALLENLEFADGEDVPNCKNEIAQRKTDRLLQDGIAQLV